MDYFGFIGGGISSADLARITTLENNELKILYYASVNTGTGTITVPANATIILGDFPQGLDAIAETIINGVPSGISPKTAGGVTVTVSSFDTAGNYVLSGVPSAYPVAILYILKIKSIYYSSLNFDNIIESQVVDAATVSYVDAGLATKQDLLVSGTNIKTINGNTLLGSGDLVIASGVSSVTGTTNRITSTGGATPVIDISTSYVGQASITTLGTIGTGTWHGTVIATTYGGTGSDNSTNTSGSFLRSNGANGNFDASTLILPNSITAGNLVYGTSTNNYGSSTALTYLSNVLKNNVSANGEVSVNVQNANTGASARATVFADNNTYTTLIRMFGTNYTTSGLLVANLGQIQTNSTAGMLINTGTASTYIKFAIGGTAAANEVLQLNSTSLTLYDAINIVVGTTTGTKYGTATTQKQSFWNATPIVQPTTAVAAATFVANTSLIANDTATFDGYTIGQITKALRNIGLLA